MTRTKKIRVLELAPSEHTASKPAELIQIRGHDALSLTARRAITVLWHNAHRQGIEDGKTYQIQLNQLTTERHKGRESVVETIEALMTTLLVVPLPGGKTRRVQVLGGTDMDSPDRPGGTLSYSFDWRLIEILRDSGIWGRISIPTLMALSSKYSISLYEAVAQWFGLRGKTASLFTLDEFRALLGVPSEAYALFGDLNRIVLKRAVAEINALALFNIDIQPQKTGKQVTHLLLSWWPKTPEEQWQASVEVSRPKPGRRARISGAVDRLVEPVDNGDNSPESSSSVPGSIIKGSPDMS